MNAVLDKVARNADGTYRVAAGRVLPGKILGGFRYAGTRPDDPNDIVPHEHRRELRALRVFGAWTNLTDLKAGNTLDTLVTENGRGVVKHYLQDVGVDLRHGQRSARVGHRLGVFLRKGAVAATAVLVRLRAEPLADRPVHRIPVDRPVRRRRLRSDEVEAADADHRVHGAAGRRCLLGGPAGDGVQRRSHPRRGPHRSVQRSGRRASSRRRC